MFCGGVVLSHCGSEVLDLPFGIKIMVRWHLCKFDT